ncbi:hypothetical protein SAMN05660649_04835 [Desulfotomaculum arcticum]|uniref:Uncharacterized protein n=1 Tax=Desulfotruncus arcticus DSM 17038 TaxID=1121424 RepID=A0A1I2Z9F5_9FIRM|nr:hypothetical protein [Desulfotruncus arcticus]SFH34483.1 hypothetical protein SAMN05660649_04835 [Desulfotomaculum arcticum] [Desulfotruncus arcticus DSM 17038]
MLKHMKPGREYFLINIDEPYALEIYEVLKRGQMAKNEWPEGDISFDYNRPIIARCDGQLYMAEKTWIVDHFTLIPVTTYSNHETQQLDISKECCFMDLSKLTLLSN